MKPAAAKPLVACLLAAGLVAGCSGIPFRSIPRLMSLQYELADMDPAEFMVAIESDSRMEPPVGATPKLKLAITPRNPGAFEAVDTELPMRLSVATPESLGLPAAPANRRWHVYDFAPESQAELAQIQTYFKRLQAERRPDRGGSLAIGIAQEGVAAKNAELFDTHWATWLQTSQADGFFEIWSGSIGELIEQAEIAAARKADRKQE